MNIALLGFGTVGKSVYDILNKNAAVLAQKMKAVPQVKKILVRDLSKDRGVDASLLTADLNDCVYDNDIDIVVELMGDCPEALEAMKVALKEGKSVVTANKALIARHGLELFELAQENNVQILFEASVGGGIPVLRALREGLAANRIHSLMGIINGTTNFILSKMKSEGAAFEDVLKEAQELGYAEADPTADVGGHDAAYKLCILAMLCHGKVLDVKDVFVKGIHYIRPLDLQMADQFGYVIKHLGVTKLHGDEFEARVHPTMIKKSNPLAHINGSLNAVAYDGDFSKEGMLTGHGAGGDPTASAVVGDIIELGRTQSNNSDLPASGFLFNELSKTKPKDINDLKTRYYIRLSVKDEPNVLAGITSVLGKNNISVQHLYQHGEQDHDVIPLIVFTHTCVEKDIRAALKEIDGKDFVTETTKIIRIEDDEN